MRLISQNETMPISILNSLFNTYKASPWLILSFITSLHAVGFLSYLALVDVHKAWFTHSVFFFISTAFALTLMLAWQQLNPGRTQLKWLSLTLLAALFVTGIIFLTQGIEFRVLSDETNLLATSRGLYQHLQLINITEVYKTYQQETILTSAVAHRPGLFASLTAYVHFLIGFSWFSPFIVNFIVSVVTLSAIIWFFKSHVSLRFGLIAALLMAAFPIYQLNITSAGFDALNMLIVMLVFMQIWRFMTAPSGQSMELLLLLALLAAHARYESAGLTLVVLFAILLHGRQIFHWQFSAALPIIPLLYIPTLWQKLLSSNFANPGDAAEKAFDLSNLFPNWLNMWAFFLDLDHAGQPTQIVISLLAIAGLVMFLIWAWPHRKNAPGRTAFILILFGQSILSIAHFAYYFGDYQLAWINRLAQIQLIWLIPLATMTLYWLTQHWKQNHQALMVILILGLWFSSNHIARDNPVGQSLTLYREFKDIRRYLEQFPTHRTLIINQKSGLYTALGYSAIKPKTFKKDQNALRLQLKQGLWHHIIWIDSALTKKANDKPVNNINPKILRAEPLQNFQVTPTKYARVYRLEPQK